ncbi:MAG: tRNA (adenosine(37)-N6)-threonylcarbamoyltransferase complex transferase subunit TsaD, partial [Saprospiraceae bacterium]|nr:tRNA (adenosine(37)-N6)-threonylcarbamoyltransferase complex transferase subunit TsaD [Saprospiraceae bacterium]
PNFIEENLNDLCASIQTIIVSTLMKKLRKASKETGIREIAIAGGVSANSGLRSTLEEWGKKEGWNTYIPAFQYCTDNAGMIGVTAHYKFLAGDFCEQDIAPFAR